MYCSESYDGVSVVSLTILLYCTPLLVFVTMGDNKMPRC